MRIVRVSRIAPDILTAEVGHSLRRLVLSKELDATACFEALDDFSHHAVPMLPSAPLASAAMRVALDNMASFYDSLCLSLAREHDCRLLTADERMIRAFGQDPRLAALASTLPSG